MTWIALSLCRTSIKVTHTTPNTSNLPLHLHSYSTYTQGLSHPYPPYCFLNLLPIYFTLHALTSTTCLPLFPIYQTSPVPPLLSFIRCSRCLYQTPFIFSITHKSSILPLHYLRLCYNKGKSIII